MKLDVLPQLMRIHESAKMTGDFSSFSVSLHTEKIAGNIYACLGFVKVSSGYYIPNTALKEDIRNITYRPQDRVLAVLRKPITQELYNELCYTAKGINIHDIVFPDEVKAKIQESIFA